MANEVMNFTNELFGTVRGFEYKGELYFIGKDVVNKLGYSVGTKYLDVIKRHCEPENYILMKNSELKKFGIVDAGRKGEYIINEPAMYELIFGSPLKEAKRFKDWVCDEVLPQIRMTGAYIPIVEEDDEETIMAKAMAMIQKTIDKREQQLMEEQQEITDEEQKLIDRKLKLIDRKQKLNDSKRKMIGENVIDIE